MSVAVNLPASAGDVRDMGSILCWEDPQVLGSSNPLMYLLNPWTERPGGLSLGVHRDGHPLKQHLKS